MINWKQIDNCISLRTRDVWQHFPFSFTLVQHSRKQIKSLTMTNAELMWAICFDGIIFPSTKAGHAIYTEIINNNSHSLQIINIFLPCSCSFLSDIGFLELCREISSRSFGFRKDTKLECNKLPTWSYLFSQSISSKYPRALV